LGHANKTSIINAFSQPDFVLSPLSQLRDMFEPINLINGGITASPNGTNLSFNTSAGYLHGLGINFANDTLNPDSLYVSGTNPCTFQYRTQTGGTATNVTVIDPTKYDVGGVITTLSGTKATNQRIYLVQNGVFRVQYGQTEYSTLAQAVAGLATEQYVEFSNFNTNGILIGVISVLSSATDLSDTSKALFFRASKFGESTGAAGGSATTNLQQAYNNSAEPEILTNSTLGAVTIKNGSGNPDSTSSLLEGLNSSGGVTSFIRANGSLSATTISATTISATTYQNLPSDVVIINSTQIQSGFTGGVLFQSSASTVSQTTGFTWDNVNKRLGIGTNSPLYDLDVYGSIYQKTGELLITSTGGVNKEGPFIASSGGDEVSSDRKIQLGISDNSTVPVGINMFVTNNSFPPSYINFRVNNADLVMMSGSSVIISGNTHTNGMTATTISATTLSTITANTNTISIFSATTGTTTSYLGLDSNNRVIKATVPGSNNQLLTSNGSGLINAQSGLTYDGSTLRLLYQSGDEGGEMLLSKPVTNTSISGTGVSIDVYQNKYRIFEQGGSARGAYIDITDLDTSVGVNLAPWRYLYVTRATSNQTIGSGTWANIDIIFNNQVVSKGITYNTSTGRATLPPGVYRITAQLAWQAAAVYTIQFSCYDSSNNQLGPTVEMIQSTNSTNNISNGYLDFIYTVTNTIDVKIKTTNSTNALSGEQIRFDLNTSMIIQQIG